MMIRRFYFDRRLESESRQFQIDILNLLDLSHFFNHEDCLHIKLRLLSLREKTFLSGQSIDVFSIHTGIRSPSIINSLHMIAAFIHTLLRYTQTSIILSTANTVHNLIHSDTLVRCARFIHFIQVSVLYFCVLWLLTKLF